MVIVRYFTMFVSSVEAKRQKNITWAMQSVLDVGNRANGGMENGTKTKVIYYATRVLTRQLQPFVTTVMTKYIIINNI